MMPPGVPPIALFRTFAKNLSMTKAMQGWLDLNTGDAVSATKSQEAAVWVALAAHRDDVAAESAANCMSTTGYYLGQREEGNRWEKVADALLRRLGPGHDRTAAWFYQDRANIRQREGHNQAAISDYEKALGLKQRALAPNHPDIALSLLSMASVDNELGNHVAALAAADRAVDIFRNAFAHSGKSRADVTRSHRSSRHRPWSG